MELRGRELVERIAGAADRPARPGGAALVARQPRAGGDDRGPAGQRARSARAADRAGRTSRARARGPPPAGRRRWRARSAAASPPRARWRRHARRWRRERRPRRDAPRRRDRGARPARLLELQHPDGYWVGELESNATMIAQHLFWHHVLGLRTPELDRKIANELLARQRDDGTWSIWFEGPGRPLDDGRGLRGARSSPASTRARRRATSSARAAGSRRRGSSPSASSRCSASGRGSG